MLCHLLLFNCKIGGSEQCCFFFLRAICFSYRFNRNSLTHAGIDFNIKIWKVFQLKRRCKRNCECRAKNYFPAKNKKKMRTAINRYKKNADVSQFLWVLIAKGRDCEKYIFPYFFPAHLFRALEVIFLIFNYRENWKVQADRVRNLNMNNKLSRSMQ